MKALKNISVLLLLVMTMFFYLGHDIVDYYGHVTVKIENTANHKGAQKLASQESSPEEDFHLYFPGNAVQIAKSGGEGFTSIACSLPPKLFYSIWLPPDIA